LNESLAYFRKAMGLYSEMRTAVKIAWMWMAFERLPAAIGDAVVKRKTTENVKFAMDNLGLWWHHIACLVLMFRLYRRIG
jgi:hypothetical protein